MRAAELSEKRRFKLGFLSNYTSFVWLKLRVFGTCRLMKVSTGVRLHDCYLLCQDVFDMQPVTNYKKEAVYV